VPILPMSCIIAGREPDLAPLSHGVPNFKEHVPSAISPNHKWVSQRTGSHV
jgi:hypothetical protein